MEGRKLYYHERWRTCIQWNFLKRCAQWLFRRLCCLWRNRNEECCRWYHTGHRLPSNRFFYWYPRCIFLQIPEGMRPRSQTCGLTEASTVTIGNFRKKHPKIVTYDYWYCVLLLNPSTWMNRSSFFESFNSEFEKLLPETKSYQAAFDAASNKFKDSVGNAPYNSWDSFKTQRSKRRKKWG